MSNALLGELRDVTSNLCTTIMDISDALNRQRTVDIKMLSSQEWIENRLMQCPTKEDLGIQKRPIPIANVTEEESSDEDMPELLEEEYGRSAAESTTKRHLDEVSNIIAELTTLGRDEESTAVESITETQSHPSNTAEPQESRGRGRGSSFDKTATPGRGSLHSSKPPGSEHGHYTRASSRSPPPDKEMANPAQERWGEPQQHAHNATGKVPKIVDSGCTSTFVTSAEGARITGEANGSVVFGGKENLKMPMKYSVWREDTGPAIVVENLPQELHSVSKYGIRGLDTLFCNGMCYIYDRQTLRVKRVAVEKRGLYYIDDSIREERSIMDILNCA